MTLLYYYIIIKYYGDDVSIRKSPSFRAIFRRLFGLSFESLSHSLSLSLSLGAVVHQVICDPGIRLSASIAFDLGRDNYCDNRLIIMMTPRATIARCWCFLFCFVFNILTHSRVAN